MTKKFLFIGFYILNFSFNVYCDYFNNSLYDKSQRYTPDRTFDGLNYNLLELRDLYFYPDAWTRVPKGFFDNIPSTYNDFYENMSKDNLKRVMTGLMKNVTNKDRRNEIFTILIRYAYCYRKIESSRNCPHPCNNKPCINFKNTFEKANDSLNDNCRKINKNNNNLDESITAKFSKISIIFKQDYECICPIGYVWEMIKGNGNCVQYSGLCKTRPCNFGTCFSRNNSMGYECKCFPAFTGLQCDITYDPCLTTENQCGNFTCVREPGNILTGYRCECGVKFKPESDLKPTCIDIDECLNAKYKSINEANQNENSSVCSYRGKCFNTIGDYHCDCIKGFEGKDCEQDMTEIYKYRLWEEWEEWSSCSEACGHGYQTRTRSCEQKDSCGNDPTKQIRSCIPTLPKCTTANYIILQKDLKSTSKKYFDGFNFVLFRLDPKKKTKKNCQILLNLNLKILIILLFSFFNFYNNILLF